MALRGRAGRRLVQPDRRCTYEEAERSLILTWDEAPTGFRPYCLAACLFAPLKGAARRVAMYLHVAELRPFRGQEAIGDQAEEPSGLMRGINNVIEVLAWNFGPPTALRRGESMDEFFTTTKYPRRLG